MTVGRAALAFASHPRGYASPNAELLFNDFLLTTTTIQDKGAPSSIRPLVGSTPHLRTIPRNTKYIQPTIISMQGV
eukprot:CAMPEP_0181291416 /NCGR_PEP_ID=MMETSP1101-20121128/1954_1 /TAXON_ID=46948 /ORGANISM="Rhodomonas abbreviata, Strain Caron Lab Isolate" /LENGTH=75 /DNA_ID=CAMNT_0023395803 /DNA_START=41 /DNA_END=264 /DNA_ORIENTATION=+